MKLPFTVNWFMGIIAAIYEKYSCLSRHKNFYFAGTFFAGRSEITSFKGKKRS